MELKTAYPPNRQADITTKAVALSRKDTSGPKCSHVSFRRVSFPVQRCLSDIILDLSAKMR